MGTKEKMAVMVAMGVATGRLAYDELDPLQRALFDGWGWGIKTDAEPRERAEMIVLTAIFAAHDAEDDGR